MAVLTASLEDPRDISREGHFAGDRRRLVSLLRQRHDAPCHGNDDDRSDEDSPAEPVPALHRTRSLLGAFVTVSLFHFSRCAAVLAPQKAHHRGHRGNTKRQGFVFRKQFSVSSVLVRSLPPCPLW